MLEDAEFKIDCPNCKKEFNVRVDQVGTSVVCPHCKATVNLKDAGFKDKIKDVENQLDHLLDGLK